MPPIPRDRLLDSTRALWADPYGFIPKRCRRLHSELFEARIMLRRTICMTGPQAADVFYDSSRFQRRGAAPEPLRATLFGKGGVQGLDDELHQQRKALFLQVLSPPRVEALAEIHHRHWLAMVSRWAEGSTVVLYTAAHEVLARSACEWAGVPVLPQDLPLRMRQLVPLFDGAARGPLQHLRARLARWQAEHWLTGVILGVRRGLLSPAPGTALHLVAWHRDAGGSLLWPRVAAVELLNLLRPTVAVSVYVVWLAHALARHPEWRQALRRGNPAMALNFLQEVQRHYPFFPAVVAKVRRDFEWHGFHFAKGRRVVLDLHGTNHDPRAWQSPEDFMPERFRGSRPGDFDLARQDGLRAEAQHRCPGEGAGLALMAVALDVLVNHVDYTLPPQDLEIDPQHVPALPRSRFVIQIASRHA